MSITAISSPGSDLAALPRFAKEEAVELRGVRFWVVEITPTRLVLATGIDPALDDYNARLDRESLERLRSRNVKMNTPPGRNASSAD